MTLKGIVKDSIEPVLSNISGESFLRKFKGKLIKGSTATGTVPTIPSKYFTVVSDNSDNKGFLKSSRRFSYENTDAPGPGSYAVEEQTKKLRKESDGNKSSGPFSSNPQLKTYVETFKNNTPGAGTYNIDDQNRRHDFSRGFSRAFQKPIIETKESQSQKDKNNPAPNQYDISKSNKLKFRANNVCADAAFKSHNHRLIKSSNNLESGPAPGTYDINEKLKYKSVTTPYSSFKSSSKRTTFTPTYSGDLPGPADYRPYDEIHENANRQLMPRRHYLAISAPAVPVSKDIATPGPGAYNVRSFEEPDKKYMTSAVFVSCTSRWTGDMSETENPGPTSYSPLKLPKQSFLYNYERKWV